MFDQHCFYFIENFSERGAMVKFKSLALAGSFPKFSAVALGTLIKEEGEFL